MQACSRENASASLQTHAWIRTSPTPLNHSAPMLPDSLCTLWLSFLTLLKLYSQLLYLLTAAMYLYSSSKLYVIISYKYI